MSNATPHEENTERSMILFVAGDERNSRTARANLSRLNEEYLGGRSNIEIVDVLEDYQKAIECRVLLTPTLLIVQPPPPVRIIGTLENTTKVLAALGLTRGEICA
jgi:circadian clock protein KaiB